MAEFYTLFREVLRERDCAACLEQLEQHEAHRGTTASLTTMLEQAGLAISRAIEERFHLRYLDGTAFFNHSFVKKRGFLDGWRGVINAEDEEAVFARLEARLNERAAQDGETTDDGANALP